MKNKLKFLAIILAISTAIFSNSIVSAMKNENNINTIEKTNKINKEEEAKNMEEAKNIFKKYGKYIKYGLTWPYIRLGSLISDENKRINSIIKDSTKYLYKKQNNPYIESKDEFNELIETIELYKQNFKEYLDGIIDNIELCKNVTKQIFDDYVEDLKKDKINYSKNEKILEYADSEIKKKHNPKKIKENIETFMVEDLKEQKILLKNLLNEYINVYENRDNLLDENQETNEEQDGLLNECIEIKEHQKKLLNDCNELIKMIDSNDVSFEKKVVERFKFGEKIIEFVIENLEKEKTIQNQQKLNNNEFDEEKINLKNLYKEFIDLIQNSNDMFEKSYSNFKENNEKKDNSKKDQEKYIKDIENLHKDLKEIIKKAKNNMKNLEPKNK